ncbi:MAG: O-antigen ligase family protein [Anaerolineae bacterium]|nr:O-antigen ligase family protein [Anaerolineae bacterium]
MDSRTVRQTSTIRFHQHIFPILDIALAALAGAVWYVHPQIGIAPFGLIVVAWVLRWLVYGYPTRATLFDFPIMLFLVTAFIAASIAHNQGVEWSQHLTPLEWAWGKYYYILGAIGLYYAIANLRTIDQVWWFVRAYALFGTIVAVYFLLTNDWTARGVKFPILTEIGLAIAQFRPDIPGRRLHPNVAGGMLAMILPFFVVLLREAWATKRARQIAFWGATMALVLLTWLLTASRGAWLALGVVSVAWIVSGQWTVVSGQKSGVRGQGAAVSGQRLALSNAEGSAVGTQRQTWNLKPLIIVVALLSIVVIALNADALFAIEIPGGGTIHSRWDLWTASLALARDYFFTGGGLGAFPMLFSTYYLLVPVYFTIYSHNLFLDILIEQGIVGLCSYVWLLTVFIWFAIRSINHRIADCRLQIADSLQSEIINHKSKIATRSRWIIEASLASVAVMLIHGLVDDIPYGSRALLIWFVPFAMVAALAPHLPRVTMRVPSATIPAAIVLVALVFLWQRDAIVSAWYANLGAVEQARIELANYKFPERIPETTRKTVRLMSAERHFYDALQFDPDNVTANQRLAMIALARGMRDDARAYLERAYRREPTNGVTRKLLLEIGD